MNPYSRDYEPIFPRESVNLYSVLKALSLKFPVTHSITHVLSFLKYFTIVSLTLSAKTSIPRLPLLRLPPLTFSCSAHAWFLVLDCSRTSCSPTSSALQISSRLWLFVGLQVEGSHTVSVSPVTCDSAVRSWSPFTSPYPRPTGNTSLEFCHMINMPHTRGFKQQSLVYLTFLWVDSLAWSQLGAFSHLIWGPSGIFSHGLRWLERCPSEHWQNTHTYVTFISSYRNRLRFVHAC